MVKKDEYIFSGS